MASFPGAWHPRQSDLSRPICLAWTSTYKYKAEKRGEEVAQRDYPRPDLRLVTDEDWFLCNPEKNKRKNNGGGKNALAGILTCGCRRWDACAHGQDAVSVSKLYCAVRIDG